ncbi:hypothetical protein CO230_07660 [Chryseobacterium sp. 6424]|uniref:RagB/SusD family nutrient uptake outer membrane protein n=1 Tax=Chryseobacterium sp. 6424 TaxID=2039166 RepID=UPI000EFADD04|nr:RagB/SusD family nutrient uptake outer membrane protein [Chryseobacterium sp. 6424]AYO58010.1 hypothetical protein CO230_07660 [Chryseobacterium sp. 6424]
MNRIYRLKVLVIILITLTNCRDFLSEKSDVKLAIPEKIEDNQALLDQYGFINIDFSSIAETSSDDIYLNDSDYNSLPYDEYKRLYTWQPDNVTPPVSVGNAWVHCYRAIYICNSVLKNINDYNLTGIDADNVKGQALALRAIRYLDGVQAWCKAYNSATAGNDLGLPLKLDPDMNAPSTRSSLQDTYAQIIADLKSAIDLLPEKQISVTRMSKTAAQGILARTYLYMGDYENSLKYSLESLKSNSKLLNYNQLNQQADFPINDLNEEILFWGAMKYDYHLIPAKIPLSLFNSYSDNDLRKNIFFRTNASGEILFKGYYLNSNGPLCGIAVDEIFLMAAESYIRKGNIVDGLAKLNELSEKRWKIGTFIPFSASTQEDALEIVLTERRKELILRGLRWADIKRLNLQGKNIVLNRNVNGQSYILQPNDLKYAIAIPEDIIKLTGMQQNPR